MATREETYTTPNTHERAITQVLTRAYVLNWEAITYAALFVVALITRFVDLGARVMSHDESLHTYYSWGLYENGEFEHTPLMHGPLLFHMTALAYFLFGDTDFTARIYPALLGALIVVFPVLFRRWLGRAGALITAVLLLISPQLMYYSRYIRHDIPLIFFALLMLYAIMQYLDGQPARRAVWLWVMGAAVVLMLASKEVAFIYIALFGSFLTVYWLLRMMQDIGVRHPDRPGAPWQSPRLQLALGHAIIFVLAVMVAFFVGEFIHYALSASLWIASGLWFILPLVVLLWGPLALSGVVRSLLAGAPRDGAAGLLMRGLGNGRSALQILVAGAILGGLLALTIVCVIDIIKLDEVWQSSQIMSQMSGAVGSKEYAQRVTFDAAMFARLLTWVGLPALALAFVLFLSAVFNFPGHLPLPWRKIALVLLVALIVAMVLVAFERRSFVEEAQAQPRAANPNEVASTDGDGYNNVYLLGVWLLGAVAVSAVLLTRFLTPWWDFLNRQPIFDVLIVLGTLIFPWLAAFPVYWAGYNLENYNSQTTEGYDTIVASLWAMAPFIAVAVAVGLAWNWKRWLPVGVIFVGTFAFFFTTVFSNSDGIITGMVGSLGYWLEQQGVRRGSQPQYYYMLTQLPVYEFLPMIGAAGAGLAGLGTMWRWQRARTEQTLAAAETLHDDMAVPAAETQVAATHRTQPVNLGVEPDAAPQQPSVVHYDVPRLFRPYDPAEETQRRREDPEWVGSVPFVLLVGYWAIMIIFGLTVAGEKMPWLTTHLTLPLILLSGWWLGRVVTGIQWRDLGGGGWLALLGALPLGYVALAQIVTPLWGSAGLFQGRTAEVLTETGAWFAAVLILVGAVYVIVRYASRLGMGQLGRMAVLTGVVLLAVLTARAAVMATFINHDYATEFLVYAHSGPGVKTVMEEVDRIAELTDEGYDMRIVFDDQSSWPFTWYFRNYRNYGFLAGEAGTNDPAYLEDVLRDARVVVVGPSKSNEVRNILGDRYYEFSYIRLWWPMQEYFYLNYDRVTNVFSMDEYNIAADYYRQALSDIWWSRDYDTYAQAMCIENKQDRCIDEAARGKPEGREDRYREICQDAVVRECADADRFEVKQWPVSERLYFFVDKQVAAQVWDAGIGTSAIDVRLPEYPEDDVYTDVTAHKVIGEAAGLSGPRDVVIDDDGNLYVADTENNRIVVMTPDGQVIRTIGEQSGGTAQAGSLLQPWGVALGPDDLLYVADTWNNRVQVFTRRGEFVRMWSHAGIDQPPDIDNVFYGPRDIAIGPDGNVYVSDTGNKRISVYTPEGQFIRDIGSGGTARGQLDEPVGLAFNPVSGELYVAEAWNRRIQVFDAGGTASYTWTVNMWFHNKESYNRPYVAVNPDGSLVFVTDMDENRRVVAYNLDGVPVLSFRQPEDRDTGRVGMRSPAGMAFDRQGQLYVVDGDLSQIFVFKLSEISGSVPPELSQPDQPGADPSAFYPAGSSNADFQPVIDEINGVPMAYVPAGCFRMGPDSLGVEPDGTEICLDAFWISQTEVTQAQYQQCVAAGACDPLDDRTYYGKPEYSNYPVILLEWEQAQQYAAWFGGQLPTQAQWEYAARGPEGWRYPWGNADPTCQRANSAGCGGLAVVGPGLRSAGASWVGALDMLGSVWEWTADWSDPDYYAGLADGILNPPGPPSGAQRAVRGGAWNTEPRRGVPVVGSPRDPDAIYGTVGLRVIVPATPATQPPDQGAAPGTDGQDTAPAAGALGRDPLAFIPAGTDNLEFQPIVRDFNTVTMAYVPAGCFNMGLESLDTQPGGTEVCLNSFWIGQTEVTQRQYQRCVAAGVCAPLDDAPHFDDPAYADYPVTMITWEQAQRYADWFGGTLPTQAQWEYAARGTEGWLFPWGMDEPTCAQANSADCDGLTVVGPTVRTPGASWVGALDMAGSVWEWTADRFDPEYYASLDDGVVDPPGPPAGAQRAVRGGSWQDPALRGIPAAASGRDPGEASEALGFRVIIPAGPGIVPSLDGVGDDAVG